ncbi:SID1 transmembrane family member 2-like [Belonocnema kinseyi]|uniref:SID1 transmembrane family member 2-like n=1 Tax=Belonocnema kinseyi TaxID=2817044 RepID=UPI00143CF70D|nr:SID1 transmembrane family member 2-like [Belonocnema kinseyi]
MKRIGAFLVISIISVVNTTLLSSSMLPPTIEEANYNKSYTKLVNSTTDYIFVYKRNKNSFLQEARVTVESNATADFPLSIVVKQKGGILFWQIPLIENLEYGSASRTLCSLNSDSSEEEPITVSLSTASSINISFRLIALPLNNFYVRSGEERNNIVISPTEPVYYSYSFDDDTKNKSVIVHLESESEICMILSIQNKSCPVFDLERNIQFSGYWQTVSKQGGITVSREKYPDGFFIVLVVKSDDRDCTDVSGKGPHQVPFLTKVGPLPRIKIVNLTLKPGISTEHYIIATLSVTSAVLALCVFYVFGELLYYKIKGGHSQEKKSSKHRQENVLNRNLAIPSSPEQFGPRLRNMQNSFLDRNLDSIEEGFTNNEVVQKKFVLCVCDLSCKEPEDLRKMSNLYTYYISTVAVFYTLPVLQLVLTDQIVLHVSGNQDLCYYNFLCSHPIGFLSDFNHVFSNIVYVLLGLLFLLVIYLREKSNVEVKKNKFYGIPQYYGLFYAMGFALMMEGVLSASYHVCPSHSNFQFDTSFMYIISVLCIVKIYQNRHSDIYPKAPAAFGFLAFVIFMGLIGVLLVGSQIFWIVFTIMHLVLCFLLTTKAYYLGKWSFDGRNFFGIYKALKHETCGKLKNSIMPLYPARLSILIMAYLCNLGLAIFGYIHHANDFSTYLLGVLMMNLVLYLFFYIIMKLCHKERIHFQPAIYIILSVLSWSGSIYFFLSTTTSWSFTPAQSRTYNSSCIFLNFFDSHDIWHFLSASAIFFSFMVLLTLDDDLTNVHRNQIPVF